MMKRLMRLIAPVVLAIAAIETAQAAPVTFNFTATVDVVANTPGVSVGQTVTGSFTFDPANFSVATTSFSASVGTFSLTEQFLWIVLDGDPDELFLEGTGSNTTQFGFFLQDPTGTALDGSDVADINLDLDAWLTEQVRWNVFDPETLRFVQGWTGTITSIVPQTVTTPVPEPTALALVAGGLFGLRLSRRRRTA